MPINRTNIVKAKLFEECAAGDHATGKLLSLACGLLQGLGQGSGHGLAELAQGLIAAARDEPRHIGAHATDGRGDGHVIVVQNNDQLLGCLSGIVHGLIGHARAHRAITDNRDDLIVVAALVAGGAEAKGG